MKKTISATIDVKLIDWVDKELKGTRYRNKSHLVEIALMEFKKESK